MHGKVVITAVTYKVALFERRISYDNAAYIDILNVTLNASPSLCLEKRKWQGQLIIQGFFFPSFCVLP